MGPAGLQVGLAAPVQGPPEGSGRVGVGPEAGLDVGMPLFPREGESRVKVFFSFGQAF